MEDKYKIIIQMLEQADNLDKESVLALWTGLTNTIALKYPNEFFHVIRNSILTPFQSPNSDVDFATIAGAVFYSLQQYFLTNPKYSRYFNSISTGDEN